MKRIYLSSPHMGGEELDFIHDAFEKNWIAPLGENVNKFEEDLQNYTGRSSAAVVTSGTAAIHLGLILCGVKPGDEVICQSFTFAASANPIRYQGASPVFVDSEPDTWNMDPELLEQAIVDRMQDAKSGVRAGVKRTSRSFGNPGPGKKPKAIVVVHLYGMPAKMDRILEIAAKYDIPVIEDAAEALGSSYRGCMCGNFGDYSVLSFNGNKIITTSGGGALLGDDPERIEKARFLATQARDDAPHYQHSELGYNYRMSNISAGIGRGQMKVLEEHVAARRANHDFYFEELQGAWFHAEGRKSEVEGRKSKVEGRKSEVEGRKSEVEGPKSEVEGPKSKVQSQRPKAESSGNTTFDPKPSVLDFQGDSPAGIYFLKEPEDYHSNRWLTTVLINPEETGGVTRDDIRIALEEENIECRPLWKPMHLQPLYEDFSFYGNGVSEWLFEYGLCLPSGSNMTDKDRLRTVEAIRNCL